jgi:hypothetical protein
MNRFTLTNMRGVLLAYVDQLDQEIEMATAKKLRLRKPGEASAAKKSA